MNYRHLHYFWVVATEGGMARAAERLGVAVQTISQQVKELERELGVALFKPEGRGLALTEAGQAALHQADEIFRLGEALPELVREAATRPSQRLAVGIADGLPKLLVHRLLSPVLDAAQLRLQCFEDSSEELLARLALHKLDVVLVDHVPAPNPNLKLYTHALGEAGVGWYAASALALQLQGGFPAGLAQLPVLLPSAQAVLRGQLDRWLERHGLRPRVVGEFEDAALLTTFGASGLGVFPADDRVHDSLVQQLGFVRLGDADGVREQVFAIGTEKRVQHPLVEKLLAGTGPKTAH
jgi:LysR family transcriptional regulator, transcriptional activator of nhaA